MQLLFAEQQKAIKSLASVLKAINYDRVPPIWKSAASPYLPSLVEAFQTQNIARPRILAYAAATIGHESSWNPAAVNTTDAAAMTGYPGAGLAQITWEFNYKACGDYCGINFVSNPHLMFDPKLALRAKAAFYILNNMVPHIDAGDYESAAGIYNAGNPSFRSAYTSGVATDTNVWLPVFS